MLGVLAFALFFYFNFKTVEVRGQSMEPTFESGQHVLMSNNYWLVGQIRREDFVIVRVPDTKEALIKRVKGLGGDVIDFMYVPHDWKLSSGEYKVPEGHYYVLGDNRPVSQDSRDYGAFEAKDIEGKVVVLGPEPWIFAVGLAAALLAVSTLMSLGFERSRRKRGVDP